ncbi:hypothetical protein QQF64_004832, partial [Cirrhinus molitorella]
LEEDWGEGNAKMPEVQCQVPTVSDGLGLTFFVLKTLFFYCSQIAVPQTMCLWF